MNHHRRPTRPEDQFDTWLDAFVAGTSTPATPAASDPETGEVRAAVRQFHGLARRAERSPTSSPFAPTWEDFMHAQVATPTVGPASPGSTPYPIVIPNLPEIFSAPPTHDFAPTRTVARHRHAWDRAFSAVFIAGIVLALSTGIWRASDGTLFGLSEGPPESPGIPFGGQVAQDDSNPVDLPTAEDCTVEPLTIDEVIWYIQEPLEALYSTDNVSPGPLPTEIDLATPPATNPPNYEPRPATEEELAGAAETQRMLMACTLANSYFQIWGLLDPFQVREYVTSILPPLTGEDEARAILEELEQTGTAGEGPVYLFYPPSEISFLGVIPEGGAQLLSTDPANSWSEAEGQVTAGYITYAADGSVVETTSIFANRLGTPVGTGEIPLAGGSSCSSYSFTLNEARGMWLVTSAPTCG